MSLVLLIIIFFVSIEVPIIVTVIVAVKLCVHKKYHSELISIPNDTIEQLFVLVKINGKTNYVIGTCFIPPGKPVSSHLTHNQTVDYVLFKFKNKIDIILLGDYNLPKSFFSNDNTGLIVEGNLSAKAEIIFDCFTLRNFSQLNTIKNVHESMLDLVFSNISNVSVTKENMQLFKIDVYHPAFSITNYHTSSNIKINHKNNITPAYNFHKADFYSISLALDLVHWDSLMKIVNIDIAVINFYEIFFSIIDKFVPKYYTRRNKFPPWFNKQLKE